MTTDLGSSRRFGRFELQPVQRQLLLDGVPTALGARAFDALLVLFERRDRVVSKVELLDLVWPGLVVEDNNLQQQISSLRKLLGSQAITTVARRGYRFTAAAAIDAEPLTEAGAARTAHPNNLQRARTRFIGREACLRQCDELLGDSRLLTLTGMGGCGKTRLAQQLAASQLDRHPDGVWWIDLAVVQEEQGVAAAMVSTLSASLGLRDEVGTPVLGRLKSLLASRCMLIVLDNCEHVAAAASELIEALLADCEQVKIIATSREVLGLAGEQIYPVPSLVLPVATDLASVQQSEAAWVFADRARLVQPSFDISAENAAGIAEICRRLDGVVLAIELAAACVKVLSIDEIRARLDQRFQLLTGGHQVLARHQTLQAAIQWSHDHLTPEEQQLLGRLSVFAAGCSLEAAQYLVDGADEFQVLQLLTRLHDKSLLLVDLGQQLDSGQGVNSGGDGASRYRLLETVRQYAQERLKQGGGCDDARGRHLRYCVALAEQAETQLTGSRQSVWMARLRIEQEDMLAAHAWCQHAEDGAELGLRLVAALWRYWLISGQLHRGHALALAALARPGGGGRQALERARCRVLLGQGQTAFRMGRYEESLACAQGGLALAQALGDAAQAGLAQGMLANGLAALGQPVQARAEFEQASNVARSLGDRFQLATVLNNLAELHRGQGQLSAAEACYGEALAIGHELHNIGINTIVSCNLARLLVADGRFDLARRQLLECQAMAQAAGLKGLGEDWLEVAACLAIATGDHATGARLHGASLARMQEAGARREPVDDAVIAPLVAKARQGMGAAPFDAAEAAGRALSFDASMAALKAWLEGGGLVSSVPPIASPNGLLL